MTDPKQDVRQQFEAWYVENVFAYEANPLGSRDCGLQRKAWQAALQSPAVRELVEAAKVYVGPMDDPGIGWCGSSSSHPGLFKCERCGQEHTDCSLIPHRPDCSAARLLAALRTLGA